MADDAVVISAPAGAQDGLIPPLVVSVAGVSVPALTIKDTLYVPAAGDNVTTIPLSDGSVLLLGPSS